MDSRDKEIQQLREVVAELTRRVFRLEQALNIEEVAPAAPVAEQVPAAVPPASVAEQRPAATPPYAVVPPPAPPATAAAAQSLESRIGGQWLNRIGIIAVLVGVSYFLKYAFENNWIGPAGRVAIGLIAGIAVVLWSERFRTRGYKVFSYSLMAVGIGTLYLSLWAAYQMYHLVPSGVAFLAMIVVTASTAALALQQDAEILAAFALLGGFLTPVLVSTGQNHEVALFSYLALLDIATVAFAVLRGWRRLLPGSFVATLMLYVAWYFSYYRQGHLALTFGFVTLFFVIFSAPALIVLERPVGEREGSFPPPILTILTLLNAAVYFLQGYVMLEEGGFGTQPYEAWFAVVLGGVYLLLARGVQARTGELRNSRLLSLLHLSLAIVFLTIAIPLKLEAHWITIGWLVEAALLMWIGQRTNTPLLKILATAALALGVVRLLFFDDFRAVETIFLNARFATYLVAIAALAFTVYTLRDTTSETERMGIAAAIIGINLLALVALHYEVMYYFERQIVALQQLPRLDYPSWQRIHQITTTRDFAYSAVWMAYGAFLMWVGFARGSAFLRWQAIVLIAVTIAKVFIYDVSNLERGYRIASFIALGVILLGISFVYQRDLLRLSKRSPAVAPPEVQP